MTDEVQVRQSVPYGPAQLELVDAAGRRIRILQIDVNMSNIQLPVSLEGLPAGIYFLRLHSDAGSITQKLIRQ